MGAISDNIFNYYGRGEGQYDLNIPNKQRAMMEAEYTSGMVNGIINSVFGFLTNISPATSGNIDEMGNENDNSQVVEQFNNKEAKELMALIKDYKKADTETEKKALNNKIQKTIDAYTANHKTGENKAIDRAIEKFKKMKSGK